MQMPPKKRPKKRIKKVTRFNGRDYKSDIKYTKFRKDVRKRDNYECEYPSCTFAGPIHVHHIRRWANFPQLRYNVKNGICLCYKHHKMVTGKEELYEIQLSKIVFNKMRYIEGSDG